MPPPSLPPLYASLPEPFQKAADPVAPWGLLGDPLESTLDALPSEQIECAVAPETHLLGDRIVIGRGTRLAPGVVIEGPVKIGRDCDLRPGAYLRGGVWLGDGCIVGAHTELKRSILCDGARAPHQNYVGDSILGSAANLGAGTILSNFRHDGGEIQVPYGSARLSTGRRKLGALLGDGVKTGCNCVLHPGVIVGRETQIYPGTHLRPGVYPTDSIVKLRQEVQVVPRDTR